MKQRKNYKQLIELLENYFKLKDSDVIQYKIKRTHYNFVEFSIYRNMQPVYYKNVTRKGATLYKKTNTKDGIVYYLIYLYYNNRDFYDVKEAYEIIENKYGKDFSFVINNNNVIIKKQDNSLEKSFDFIEFNKLRRWEGALTEEEAIKILVLNGINILQ